MSLVCHLCFCLVSLSLFFLFVVVVIMKFVLVDTKSHLKKLSREVPVSYRWCCDPPKEIKEFAVVSLGVLKPSNYEGGAWFDFRGNKFVELSISIQHGLKPMTIEKGMFPCLRRLVLHSDGVFTEESLEAIGELVPTLEKLVVHRKDK